MATKKQWIVFEKLTLDGEPRLNWRNSQTGQTLLTREDENPNTMPLVNPAPEPLVTIPASALAAFQEPQTDEPEFEETATDRIAAGLLQIKDQAGSKIIVSKIDKTLTKPVFVCEMTPEEYEAAGELSYIQKNYGGGEYEIMLRGPGKTGRHGIIARPRVVIADPPLLPAAVNGAPDSQAGMMQVMFKGMEAIITEIRQLKNAPVNQGQDMMQTLATFKAMREAMGIDSIAPAAAPAQNPMTMFKQFMELKQMLKEDMAPEPEKSDDPVSKLLDMAGPLISTLANAHKAGTLPPDVAAQVGAVAPLLPMVQTPAPVHIDPQPNPAPVAQPSETESVNYFQRKAITMYLQSLNAKAEKNEPVTEAIADEVANALPEDVWAVLQLPTWWDFLVSEFPIVTPYQAWYAALRDKLLETE